MNQKKGMAPQELLALPVYIQNILRRIVNADIGLFQWTEYDKENDILTVRYQGMILTLKPSEGNEPK